MPISKNKGPLLTTKIRGSVESFPQEFLSLVGLDIFVQEVPLDIETDPILGLLLESKIVQERTNERKKTNTFLSEFPDDSLPSEVFIDESGMTGERSRQLVPEGSALPVDNRTESGDQHNLGNGWVDQVVVEAPDLYHKRVYGAESRIVTPEDFLGQLPVKTFETTEDGQAVPPPDPLPDGIISDVLTDDTIWHYRQSLRYIDVLALPKFNVNHKTNEFKQDVTVTRILEDDSTPPTPPSALRDVEWTKLGDGTALEIRSVTDELFPRLASSIEYADLIPDIFKAVLPVYVREHAETGIVDDPPDTDPGDLEKTEQQMDLFNKRIRVRGRGAITVPQTKIAERKLSGMPFGGEETTLFAHLNDIEPVVNQGFDVVDSKVRDLGNGRWVRETERLEVGTEWPELEGQEYDEGLDVLIPFIEKVIEAGTESGAPQTDIKPMDKWRSKKRTIDSTAAEAVLGAYLMEYPSKTNVSMPDILVSLAAQMTSQTGDAADSETGETTGYGNYSINLDLRADATASATIIPEVFAEIRQFYGPNIDCIHYVFFLPNPVTQADVIAKINSLLSPDTVSPWPKFNPQTVTLLMTGNNSALKVNAVSKGSYSQSADLSSQSSTAGGGTGYSRSKGLTLRRMQISPTIHSGLSVSGTTSTTVNLNAACEAEAVGLGPFETIDLTDSVGANVTPTSISATPGAVEWPTTGKFMYRVDARPYKYGFVMFHVIVVDAADFPSNV